MKKNNLFAIHAIFIAKENILFMEEWIDYHINLGFDKFYLYDNSKVNSYNNYTTLWSLSGRLNGQVPGKVNKYGIDYDELVKLTDLEIKEILDKLTKKYEDKVFFFEWSPRDFFGNILFDQDNAHNHCLEKFKNDNIDWGICMDMDEFIVIKNYETINDYINNLSNDVSNIKLSQIRFDSRFNNINKLITEIDFAEDYNYPMEKNSKNLFKVNKTSKLTMHTWRGEGISISPKLDDIWFNHYKINNSNWIIINNNDNKIKNKIKEHSKNYILNNYVYL